MVATAIESLSSFCGVLSDDATWKAWRQHSILRCIFCKLFNFHVFPCLPTCLLPVIRFNSSPSLCHVRSWLVCICPPPPEFLIVVIAQTPCRRDFYNHFKAIIMIAYMFQMEIVSQVERQTSPIITHIIYIPLRKRLCYLHTIFFLIN